MRVRLLPFLVDNLVLRIMAKIPCQFYRRAVAVQFSIPFDTYRAAAWSDRSSKITVPGDVSSSAVVACDRLGSEKCAHCDVTCGVKLTLVSLDIDRLLDVMDSTEPLSECLVRFVTTPQSVKSHCEHINKEICLAVRRGNNLDYTDAVVVLQHIYSKVTVTVELFFGEIAHPCWFATKNLQGLLYSKDKADVTFIVDGEEIPAHTLILSISSVVFNKMLKFDPKIKSTGIVEIFGTNLAAFKEMLRFIYTGALPTSCMEDELLLGIMALSEKYALRHLTLACERRFLETMSESNACDRLQKVKRICPDFLETVVKRYVASYIVQVMNSDAWDALEMEDPQLVIQVMKYCLTRKEAEENK